MNTLKVNKNSLYLKWNDGLFYLQIEEQKTDSQWWLVEEEYKEVILWKVLESQVVDFEAGNLWEFMVILHLKVVIAHLGKPLGLR